MRNVLFEDDFAFRMVTAYDDWRSTAIVDVNVVAVPGYVIVLKVATVEQTSARESENEIGENGFSLVYLFSILLRHKQPVSIWPSFPCYEIIDQNAKRTIDIFKKKINRT